MQVCNLFTFTIVADYVVSTNKVDLILTKKNNIVKIRNNKIKCLIDLKARRFKKGAFNT